MTPLVNIRVAQNGYVLEDSQGTVWVARTLVEAAQINGEMPQNPSMVTYTNGKGAHTLENIRALAHDGQRIEAIKELRDLFSARMGLREAKELIEILTRP